MTRGTAYRTAVIVSPLLAAAGALAAWRWNAHSQCNELPTPDGVGWALVASLLATGLALVAMLLPRPRGVQIAWQVVAGLGVIAGAAAFYLASYAGPSAGCG